MKLEKVAESRLYSRKGVKNIKVNRNAGSPFEGRLCKGKKNVNVGNRHKVEEKSDRNRAK